MSFALPYVTDADRALAYLIDSRYEGRCDESMESIARHIAQHREAAQQRDRDDMVRVRGDLQRELVAARAEILRRGQALVDIQDAGYSNDHYQRVTAIAKGCLVATPAILA